MTDQPPTTDLSQEEREARDEAVRRWDAQGGTANLPDFIWLAAKAFYQPPTTGPTYTEGLRNILLAFQDSGDYQETERWIRELFGSRSQSEQGEPSEEPYPPQDSREMGATYE